MNYLRDDLKCLVPYKVNNIDYDIVLNSNESPFDLPSSTKERLIEHIYNGGIFNRYPDPDATILREAIADYCGVRSENVLVASGSDELIKMIIDAFVDKGEYVLCPSPSFSMYSIYTKIGGGIPKEVKLKDAYRYDIDDFLEAGDRYDAKVVFICNPNNPTGTVMDKADIEYIIKNFDGIVVIDEAYFEFYGETMMDSILKYENAIILRTFSKAFGLAGLRVGYLVANKALIDGIYMIKSPYNINTFSQLAALELLNNLDEVEDRVSYIVSERDRMYRELKAFDTLDVIPSKANFLLIRLDDSMYVYERLVEKGILVRNFSQDDILSNCIRVSIGAKHENTKFLEALISIFEGGVDDEKR